MESESFDPDLIHAVLKQWWSNKKSRGRPEDEEIFDVDARDSKLKRNRSVTAKANALKLSCELLRIFVSEAVQRASFIAEAEGSSKIEATHLERVLPQLLLDF